MVRGVNRRLVFAVVLLVVLVAVVLLVHWERSPPPPPVPVSNSNSYSSSPSAGGSGKLRALYYDSLSREYPNVTLEKAVVSMLEKAGYSVDVYVGRNATLGPLENLGTYDLVLIRAHGAFNGNPESGRPLGTYVYTGLYMSEAEALYGKGWVSRALKSGLIAPAVIPPPGWNGSLKGLPEYMAVSPKFFQEYLGEFKRNPVIVYDGCYGLNDTRLGDVFLAHGAKAFLAWKGDVTPSWADTVLLETVKLLVNGTSVSNIPEALGSLSVDPVTGGVFMVVTNNK